jgi:hypothetical protein
MQSQIQQVPKKDQAKFKERLQQKWEEFITKIPNIQLSTKMFFLRETLPIMNEQLTYQDEELTLSLISIIDEFKAIEEDAFPGAEQLCETAFAVDEKISFNLSYSQQQKKRSKVDETDQITRILRILSESQDNSSAKTTDRNLINQLDSDLYCLQDIIKNQRESRLQQREHFENEHDDASICGGNSHERSRSEEDVSILSDILKKTKHNRFGVSKYYYPFPGGKKVQTTTFGTTKRFAPEPGSAQSQSQQRILNSYKKSITGISASSSKLQIVPKDNNAEIKDTVSTGKSSSIRTKSKKGVVDRSLSKSQQRRDLRTFDHNSGGIDVSPQDALPKMGNSKRELIKR